MKLLYTCLSILCSTLALQAAAVVTGQVFNATHDSTLVPTIRVHLQSMRSQEQMPNELTETTTNNRGQFRFDISTIDDEATYFTAIDFQGVRYFSAGAQLAGQSSTDLSLVIYDSTHSTDGVEAFMHHIIIDDFGQALQFRETRVLSNPGNKTITETFVEEHIGQALFQFQLPAGAMNFTPLSTPAGDELIQHRQNAIDRGIFLPGKKTVSFGYEIPMQKKSLAASINVTHAAKTFDLFVSRENIVIDSRQLTDYGPFEIRGTTYHRYGMANVNAGTDIQFNVRRISRAAHEQSPKLSIILTVVLLAIATTVSFLQKKKSNSGTESESEKQRKARKAELVAQIAKLDLSTNGDVKSLQKRRRSLMIDLQNVELQLLDSAKKIRKKK